MTGDTIEWFEKRGVALKIEDDGRMFPVSNSSQTIIDCFLNEAEKHQVEVCYNHAVKAIANQNDVFKIETSQGSFSADKILVATGSNPKIWNILEGIGHTVSQPVPSLFTFNIKDERIQDIPGVVPSILKLSAFGALELAQRGYKFKVKINFIKWTFEDCLDALKTLKQDLAKKTVFKSTQFELPKRLWHKLVLASDMDTESRWADLNKSQLEHLASQLTQAVFQVDGKSTFKEEFVTAGGVNLKEVNFKTFESKCVKNLYFAGEVINVDAVTGGFNFQNAWTGAYIAAKNISK